MFGGLIIVLDTISLARMKKQDLPSNKRKREEDSCDLCHGDFDGLSFTLRPSKNVCINCSLYEYCAVCEHHYIVNVTGSDIHDVCHYESLRKLEEKSRIHCFVFPRVPC